jgi:hypothetical protein
MVMYTHIDLPILVKLRIVTGVCVLRFGRGSVSRSGEKVRGWSSARRLQGRIECLISGRGVPSSLDALMKSQTDVRGLWASLQRAFRHEVGATQTRGGQ